MATVSMYKKAGPTHLSIGGNVAVPYVVSNTIDLAEVAAKKGSAIAVGDVIEGLYIPAGSQVLFAGLQVIEEMTGTSTDATLDVGRTGGDVDAWVDGFDLDGASAGDYATAASAAITPAQVFFAGAGTIDVLVATQTDTITGGKIRVFAHVVDHSDPGGEAAGLAQLGS